VDGQTVTVNYDKRDHYGRIVGKVLTNGADAGLRQVEAGLAWHYKRYEQEQSDWDRAAYARAEVQARAEKRALWRDPEPVPHGTSGDPGKRTAAPSRSTARRTSASRFL
jgi:endonuclease YncB( thermonuclease family)